YDYETGRNRMVEVGGGTFKDWVSGGRIKKRDLERLQEKVRAGVPDVVREQFAEEEGGGKRR
ncbi:hypothetical protein TeGR_g15110, partial [Tetraparma gracilis]